MTKRKRHKRMWKGKRPSGSAILRIQEARINQRMVEAMAAEERSRKALADLRKFTALTIQSPREVGSDGELMGLQVTWSPRDIQWMHRESAHGVGDAFGVSQFAAKFGHQAGKKIAAAIEASISGRPL